MSARQADFGSGDLLTLHPPSHRSPPSGDRAAPSEWTPPSPIIFSSVVDRSAWRVSESQEPCLHREQSMLILSRGRTWRAQGHRVILEAHTVVNGRVVQSGPGGGRVEVSWSSHAGRGGWRRFRRAGGACLEGRRLEWASQRMASRAPRRLRCSKCIPRTPILHFRMPPGRWGRWQRDVPFQFAARHPKVSCVLL